MHASFFQLGRLHIPVFGVVAAVGLIAALALTQRTARYAHLDPEAVWNAGMTAVVSAFVISRLLLIVFNLRSFLHYPLLMLALPSLTGTGMLLTGIVVLAYLRWRRLPRLSVLDAIAPCALLFWGFVSLGRIAEGTRDGMPSQLPWAVGDSRLAAVHPVEVYALLVAWLLGAVMLWLQRRDATRHSVVPGRICGLALLFAGLAVFFLDFFRLPSDLLAHALLDPAQIIGVAMVLTGGVLLRLAASQIQMEDRNETAHAV